MSVLQDKTVIVTGAAAGLGRAYAVAIAAAGANVVVNDLDESAIAEVVATIESAGGNAIGHAGSVADWEVAAALTDAAVEGFGALHGLVNNAGVFHASLPWDETEAGIRRIIDVNVLGMLFCAVHAIGAMKGSGSGSIVNVTSGSHVGIAEMGTYGASKGAVASMTYSWALDAEQAGIRVNAVSPLARTGQSDLWANRDADHMDEPPPERVAPLVVYLLSDAAQNVSGQVIRLDAEGVSLLQHPRYGDQKVAAESFTPESIAAAIPGELAEQLAPVGLVRHRPLAATSGR
jgi:NAD(P)-dependent dehydrogenase (short-subunit alcohol dehydrogenase family)